VAPLFIFESSQALFLLISFLWSYPSSRVLFSSLSNSLNPFEIELVPSAIYVVCDILPRFHIFTNQFYLFSLGYGFLSKEKGRKEIKIFLVSGREREKER
jgi:hypothetical protein